MERYFREVVRVIDIKVAAIAAAGLYLLYTLTRPPTPIRMVTPTGTGTPRVYSDAQREQLDAVTAAMTQAGLYNTARINSSGQLVGGF